mmetsp:Transcript_52/g.76  ORF Transcript_52/g.76 Transcript_52/m.76 type:complete len:162 (+) Transcript_52:1-486(+)
MYHNVAVNYKSFVARVADLFSFAWETIAFAWVAHLIPPDQYQEYRYNIHRRHGGQQQKLYQSCCRCQCHGGCKFDEYEDCHFYPIPNVFDSWTSTNTSSSATSTQCQKALQQEEPFDNNTVDSNNDTYHSNENDSSWGQFVDVDSSNHAPMSRRQCFLRCQ